MAMGRAEPIGTTSGKLVKYHQKTKGGGATRGLLKRLPILVLPSPKHTSQRSFNETQCICAGMIAPIMFFPRNPVRPEKIQFSQKGQNRNFDQKYEIHSLDLG